MTARITITLFNPLTGKDEAIQVPERCRPPPPLHDFSSIKSRDVAPINDGDVNAKPPALPVAR